MSAAPNLAPLPESWNTRAPGRIRLIALALASWHDLDPVTCTKARSTPAHGSSGRTLSSRDRDALLLRLERDSRIDEQLVGAPDDGNFLGMYRRMKRGEHPFWRALADAMIVLNIDDPAGHRLLVSTLVDPGDARRALARCHALPYVTGGNAHAVDTPRYRLVRALTALNDTLGAVDFPNEIRDQEAAWEQWLAAVRPRTTSSGRRVKSDADRQALRQRDRYVVELSQLAEWPQTRIATHLGLSQPMVCKILRKHAPGDEDE